MFHDLTLFFYADCQNWCNFWAGDTFLLLKILVLRLIMMSQHTTPFARNVQSWKQPKNDSHFDHYRFSLSFSPLVILIFFSSSSFSIMFWSGIEVDVCVEQTEFGNLFLPPSTNMSTLASGCEGFDGCCLYPATSSRPTECLRYTKPDSLS